MRRVTSTARAALWAVPAGALTGVVWWLVSPLARYEKETGGVIGVGRESETAIAADGWFAVTAVVVGVLAGLAVAFLARGDRLVALVGLTLAGLLGSLVAWRVGVALGPASIDTQAAGLQAGTRFDGPLRLSALGVLLVWPTASVIVFFAAVAGLDTASRTGEQAAPPPASMDDQPRELSPADGSEPSGPL